MLDEMEDFPSNKQILCLTVPAATTAGTEHRLSPWNIFFKEICF